MKSKISRQTLATRLRSLFKEEKIHHDYLTRRYTIAKRGRVELKKDRIIDEIRAHQNIIGFSYGDAMTAYFLKSGKLVELEEERIDHWLARMLNGIKFSFLRFECLKAALPEDILDKVLSSIEKKEELSDEVPKEKVMIIYSFDTEKLIETMKDEYEKL